MERKYLQGIYNSLFKIVQYLLYILIQLYGNLDKFNHNLCNN